MGALMGLFGFVIPPPWQAVARIGAYVALALSLFGYGYLRGTGHEERLSEALRAKEEAAALTEVLRVSKLKDKVTVVYMDRVRNIEAQARVITQQVTKYVTPKADHDCPLTVGAVRLFDNTDGLQTHIYRSASQLDDKASGVALSDVARWTIEARRRFEVNRAQCEQLQEWARGLAVPPTK